MRYKRIVKTAGIWGIATIVFLGNPSGTMQTVRGEEYEYDALNRVVKVIYEDGSYIEYSYDSNGNIVKTTVHTSKPEESSKPENPDKPEESSRPENPDKPTEPDRPEAPVKHRRPNRNDESDESDEADEQEETGMSDKPLNLESAGSVGSVGKAESAGNAGSSESAGNAESAGDSGNEGNGGISRDTGITGIEQKNAEPDRDDASGEGTISLIQLLVTFFRIFGERILQWLARVM